jgi:hypothetical protein
MGGSLPQNASSKTTPARASDESASLSMRELENELVDISSSSSGLSSKVKLLFAKSKGSPSLVFLANPVYVHPSPRAKDNIPGWFALVERQGGPSSSSIVTRKSTLLIHSN